MDNVYKLFALIMENLGQVAGKIDGHTDSINTLGGQLSDFKEDMETELSSINEALDNLADLPDAVATIGNRLDALEGDAESPIEP